MLYNRLKIFCALAYFNVSGVFEFIVMAALWINLQQT